MADYPKRDPFFAHRFVRLLQKSCAAMEIGQPACLLLCYIAHTEDAMRYRGPAKFFNEQLMTTLGFRKWDQLNKARTTAVEAGWLEYAAHGKRSAGEYFVTVPAGFEMISDLPIEPEIIPTIIPENGGNSGCKKDVIPKIIPKIIPENGDKEGIIVGTIEGLSGYKQGEPSNPVPNPNPNMFDSFWSTYPRRIAKANAVKAWQKAIKATDPLAIINAAAKYAASVSGKDKQFVKHPATWLNGGCWDDETEEPPQPEILPGSDAWKKRSIAYYDEIKVLWQMVESGEITDTEYNQRALAAAYGEPANV